MTVRLTAILTVTVLALTACSGDDSDPNRELGFDSCGESPLTCNTGTTEPGGTMVFYEEQDRTTWNTVSEDGGHYATSVMLRPLVPSVYYSGSDFKATLNTTLMAAEPELTATSPQTITYTIKPEAVWSDGVPITADDFAYQFRARNTRDCPACGSSSNAGYDLMASVTGADGGRTVTATLQPGKTYPDWKDLFSTIYPAHLAKQNGDDGTPAGLARSWEWFKATQPAWSGGPFMIESYAEGQELVEVPNPRWWGTKPSLEKLIFKIVTDQSSFVPALQNGEINAGDPQPNFDMVTQVQNLTEVNHRVSGGLSWEHIDLNLENTFLKDKALREAIFRAIDVQRIIDRTVGTFWKDAKPLLSHNFVPGSAHYKDVLSASGAGAGDLEAAKKVLTDAGYGGVGTQLTTPAGEPVTLRFRHTEGNVNRAATGELVQATLKQLGITMSIQPTNNLNDALSSGDFDLIVYAWVTSPFFFAIADQLWGKDSETNYGHWANDQAETLLKQGVQAGLDEAKGAELLNQADALMAADYYVLPLFQRANFIAAQSGYVNIRPNATVTGPTFNTEEWGHPAGTN
ncbi:ABC transporter family substrate-binding protein [Actinoplanes sp. NPDC051494]|uniref:ABC transporter family substrate-binding protein n=1 Tax=Actinoplanes sp. NPDC051494 TaxID=3363907 RepID=UPI003795F635